MKQTAKPQKRNATMRRELVAIQGLLIVQFAIGMYLNFYVELPAAHPGTGSSYAPSIPWAISGRASVALALHVAIWILLTLTGVILLVRAIVSHRKRLIVGTSFGLFFILLAGSGGLTFLNRGGADKESMMMALGFILALAAYAVTFYQTRDDNQGKRHE